MKMGRLDHMLSLYERGLMYLNTLEYFRRGEEREARFDNDEGMRDVIQGPSMHVEVSIAGRVVLEDHGGNMIKSFKLWMPERKNLYIYSLTAVREMGQFPFDSRFEKFGAAAVIVKRPGLFMERLEQAVQTVGRYVRRDLVEYVDSRTHVGEMGAFRKFRRYAFQQEFRIAIEPLVITGDALEIELGPIDDIAQLVATKALAAASFSPGLD